MVMTHIHAIGQGQMSLGSKVRVETDGQADEGDCITSRANAVSNKKTNYRRRWRKKYCDR